MSKFYSSLIRACWALGLICLVASIVLRLLPTLQDKLGVVPRSGLMLAGVLFLCALATADVRGTPTSS